MGAPPPFCSERSGHFDAYDQGISFFLPNMTWLQPPGYVHQMITQTWGDVGLAVSIDGLTTQDGGIYAANAQVGARGGGGCDLVLLPCAAGADCWATWPGQPKGERPGLQPRTCAVY